MGVLDRVSYEECCGCCRYYQPHVTPGSSIGHCRRHSPQTIALGAAWPTVSELEWCGDWEHTTDA